MFCELCPLTSKCSAMTTLVIWCQCVVCADIFKPVTTGVVSVSEFLSPCAVCMSFEWLYLYLYFICMCRHLQTAIWIRMPLSVYNCNCSCICVFRKLAVTNAGSVISFLSLVNEFLNLVFEFVLVYKYIVAWLNGHWSISKPAGLIHTCKRPFGAPCTSWLPNSTDLYFWYLFAGWGIF